MSPDPTLPERQPQPAASPPWWARKWPQRGLYMAIGGLLALGFIAYQSPDMRANWETIAALCGF